MKQSRRGVTVWVGLLKGSDAVSSNPFGRRKREALMISQHARVRGRVAIRKFVTLYGAKDPMETGYKVIAYKVN